jgi:hypothetical protein
MSAINWEQQYPIAFINKADLTEFGYTDEQIAALFTDEIMAEIAANMGESYHMNFGFWEDFKRAIHVVLQYSFAWTQDCPTVLFVTDNPLTEQTEASAWDDGLVSSTPFLTIASSRPELIEVVLKTIGYIRDEAEDTEASWIYRLRNKESTHD